MALSVDSVLTEQIRASQSADPVLVRLRGIAESGGSPNLSIYEDDSLRFRGELCVPAMEVRADLLHEVHKSVFAIHPGSTKMYKDLKRHYWWPGMKKSVAEFVARCLVCQQVKADHAKTPGLLQPLSIPEWKWEHITMDFVTGLPRTPSGYDAIWVVVDRLTKSAHFIPYRVGQSTAVLARKYVVEVVRLHGVPISIVSDRDPRFVSRLW